MNEGWTYCDRIPHSADGLSVLDYYTQCYRHSSRDEWEQRIATGQILLNGLPTTATALLRTGQKLTYRRPPWQEPEVPLDFSVLYEDADVLVVAKPSGLPVLPGGGFLQNTLLWQFQQRYPESPPMPIHRLGRGTSGLLLLARSPLARAALSQQMRDRQIRKTYRALATGTTMPDRFTIMQPIGKIPYPRLGYLYAATPDGLPAHSECRVLKRNARNALSEDTLLENTLSESTLENTLLEVTILTGRPHQIRIHLAASGFPLVGDPLYGVGGVPLHPASNSDWCNSDPLPVPGDCGYHLHALHLCFTHPKGEPMSLSCPAPAALMYCANLRH